MTFHKFPDVTYQNKESDLEENDRNGVTDYPFGLVDEQGYTCGTKGS